METIAQIQTSPLSSVSNVCSMCHQSILPQYYFCPNCGKKLISPPLSTTTITQAWIYVFSIILPFMCFLFITRWPGVKYFKSKNPKEKIIGEVAWGLLILSTVVTVWITVDLVQQFIYASANVLNTDISGYLGGY